MMNKKNGLYDNVDILASTLPMHAQWVIVGDVQLAAAASSGSGTEGDPYVIENWHFDGNHTDNIGLLIQDTRKWTIVRNLFIEEELSAGGGCLNCTNILWNNITILECSGAGFGGWVAAECDNVNFTNSFICTANLYLNEVNNTLVENVTTHDCGIANIDILTTDPSNNLTLRNVLTEYDNASAISGPSVYFDSVVNLVIENLTMNSGGGFIIGECQGARINDFTKYNASYTDGFNIAVGLLVCSDTIINNANVTVKDIISFGSLFSTGTIINNSRFSAENASGDGMGINAVMFVSDFSTIINSNFTHGTLEPIPIPLIFLNCSNMIVENNFFDGGEFGLGGMGLNDSVIKDNLFHLNNVGMFVQANMSNGNITVFHNIFDCINGSFFEMPGGSNITNNAYWDYFDQTSVINHGFFEGDILPVAYNASSNLSTIIDTEPFYSEYLFGISPPGQITTTLTFKRLNSTGEIIPSSIVKIYVNGTLKSSNSFILDSDEDYLITIKDDFGNIMNEDVYSIGHANTSIEIVLQMYYLRVINNRSTYINLKITRNVISLTYKINAGDDRYLLLYSGTIQYKVYANDGTKIKDSTLPMTKDRSITFSDSTSGGGGGGNDGGGGIVIPFQLVDPFTWILIVGAVVGGMILFIIFRPKSTPQKGTRKTTTKKR